MGDVAASQATQVVSRRVRFVRFYIFVRFVSSSRAFPRSGDLALGAGQDGRKSDFKGKTVMDWEDKYRPKKFGEVWGQPHAVRQLSNLVRRGKCGRNLFLSGAVGSGKTSLVRLFARALNCMQNEQDGSPCGACEACGDPSRYIAEWDTPARGGSGSVVQDVVRTNVGAAGPSGTRVVFFDECHALQKDAQLSILKTIEDKPAGVIFCFATTEPAQMDRALLSRLHEIPIRALTPDVGFDYLQFIARQERVSFDPAALHLLVAAKPPFARDLVIALQEIARAERHIDVDLVKDYWDLGVCDDLGRYVRALAMGDRQAQIDAMRRWGNNPHEKRNWIVLFISSAYYNNVLGLDYVVDPLVHSLGEARCEFVDLLGRRLGLSGSALKPAFERMMRFWSTQPQRSDGDVAIALALFESLVNEGLSEFSVASSISGPHDGAVDRVATDGGSLDDEGLSSASKTSAYMTFAEAREIVNRSSFLMQLHAVCFNVLVRVDVVCDDDAEPHLSVGLQDLLQKFDASAAAGGGHFAAVAVIERDQGQLAAYIAAHATEAERVAFEAGCRELSTFERADFGFAKSNDAVAFHWTAVKELCAGVQCEQATGDLRRSLGIPRARWRTPGPVERQRVYFSGRLKVAKIEDACFPTMPLLSAFDSKAWKWLTRGWELKEAADRRREREARLGEIRSLDRIWGDDAGRRERERAELFEAWGRIPAEQRVRRWRGWW